MRWRQGRSVGRTLYRQCGDDPSKADELIGMMDTPALAKQVADAVNGAGDERARFGRVCRQHRTARGVEVDEKIFYDFMRGVDYPDQP